MVYISGVQYFIVSRLEDCGNWRYSNTTKSSARQLLETFVCNNLTQNSEINYTEPWKVSIVLIIISPVSCPDTNYTLILSG